MIALALSIFLISARAKRNILANIGMILVLLISFELICFFLLGMPQKEIKDFSLTPLPPEHIGTQLGTVPYSDSIYHDVFISGADTVFDVRYSINEHNIRITPDYDSTKTKFAAFYGCSIAFGFGLNDDQTFPYYFQKNSAYNAYNFGFTGYGTNHMLARLNYQNMNEVVSEKEGIGVYVFFWDHIERAIGSMDRYVKWVSNAPYYYMDDNKLVRKKAFKDGRYYTSKIYEKIYQSSIINYFEMGFPISLNEQHFELVTEMVLESKKEFEKQTGSKEFYLVIYPSFANPDKEDLQLFLRILKRKGVDCIDLSANYTYGSKSTLKGDPHPNAATNELLSKRLINELTKK